MAQPANASTLDMTHLRDHYMECIRLSTENKINSKNAFLLKLNSLTSTEAWTSEGETDFKMAGMAVDASAKIYAGRVDSVHSDTYSVLGTLGGRQSGEAEAGLELAEEQNEIERTGEKAPKKKVKSQLDKPENITLKSIEREYYMDPILQRLAAASDEEGVNGLLAVQLPMEERYFQLKLDLSEPYPSVYKSPWLECAHRTGSDCVKKLFQMWEAIDHSSPAPLCPALVGYAFNSEGQFVKMSGEQEGVPTSRTDTQSPSQPLSPQIRLQSLDDSFESPETSASEQEPLPSPPPSPVTSINRVLELIDPTEFSYLSADTLKQLREKEERFASASSKASRPAAKSGKAGNTRGPRKCQLIDFSSQLPEAALERPKSCKANKNTDSSVVAKAEQKNFYRNEDLCAGYESRELTSLFLIPSVSVQLSRQSAKLAGDEDPEGEASYYNYDAETDASSYIPFVNPVAGGERVSAEASPSHLGTDISMVAAPVIPERILLNFDTRRKQVDMKALKGRMWTLIEDGIVSQSGEEKGSIGFSQLAESLLAPSEAKSSEHLTKAILFATLLHLANEHCLLLAQPDHSADVTVFQGPHE